VAGYKNKSSVIYSTLSDWVREFFAVYWFMM